MFATLCVAAGMAAAMTGLDKNLSVDDIADTMNAVENQPMLNNNARIIADSDRSMLAERTVDVWHRLRS